jgi:hypothetical protein
MKVFSDLSELFWVAAEGMTTIVIIGVLFLMLTALIGLPLHWLVRKIERRLERRRRRADREAYAAYLQEVLTK